MTTKEKNAAKKDRVKREIARRERLFKKAGSLMLSCILFNNEATYTQVYNSGYYMGGLADDIHRRTVPGGLHKYFSSDQLKLIENAFERGHGAFEYSNVPNKKRAIAFGKKHGSDVA